MTRLNELVYSTTYECAPWMDAIDAASLARYMIVREVCNDYDGFNGSCYFHRDKPAEGSDEEPKWTFGPLWDITLNAWEKEDYLINSLPEWARAHWLPEVMKSREFNDIVRDIWNDFYPEKLEDIIEYTGSIIDSTVEAYEADWLRWPRENKTAPNYQKTAVSRHLRENAQWFDENINFSDQILSGIAETTATCSSKVNYGNGTLEISLPGRTATVYACDICGRTIFGPVTANSIFNVQPRFSGLAIITITNQNGGTEVIKVMM
ncbi:MAG: CotH kinase family protein [Muribaculaceae bacterium]|nr:CotH kinase family protein [Muribaculaceae bacterium]